MILFRRCELALRKQICDGRYIIVLAHRMFPQGSDGGSSTDKIGLDLGDAGLFCRSETRAETQRQEKSTQGQHVPERVLNMPIKRSIARERTRHT